MSINAVAYVRYSSDNQREESIDAQIRAINEYAAHNNIKIIQIYADEAKSATSDDRPQFLKMIQDSSMNKFKAVIVHKLDRFSRNRYDSAIYRKNLKEDGVKLISVLEPLDDLPESIILESVLEGMAEYYSKNLAREVMKGMKETALQCKHTGGMAPLGYDITPEKTYVINEAEAKIVRLIYEMYSNGVSYDVIINKLNSKGYSTKTARSFGKSSIHDLLRNEKYKGIYIFNRTISKVNGKRNNNKSKPEDEIIRIEGGMPQIISNELWESVKNKMDMNKRSRAANYAKEIYLLSGLIFCGKCNGAMTGTRKFAGRNKTLYLSYECSTRKRTHGCDAKAINKEFVESVVIDQLIEDLFTDAAITKMAKKIAEHANLQFIQIEKDIKQFETELTGIQTEINNIVNAIAQGMFFPSMKDKMAQLETRKANLTLSFEEAERQKNINSPSEDIIRAYLKKMLI